MHTIKIIYADAVQANFDTGPSVIETTVDNVPSAVRWLVANLGDWCIDEDIEIQLDGIIIWPNPL